MRRPLRPGWPGPAAGPCPTRLFDRRLASVPRTRTACTAPPQQRLLASPLERPIRAVIRKGPSTGREKLRRTIDSDRRTFDECFYRLLLLLMEDKGDVCVAFRNGEL